MKTPIICRRYGISERTLIRWMHEASVGAAPSPGPWEGAAHHGAHGGVSLCHSALRVVLEMLRPAERRRALRLIESRLDLTRGRAAQLFLHDSWDVVDERGPEAKARRLPAVAEDR